MMARLKMETLLVVNLSGLGGYGNSFGRSPANFEIQWLGFSGNIIQDKVKPFYQQGHLMCYSKQNVLKNFQA